MKPIQQTRKGEADGNCFEACVACLMEIDNVDEIPRYDDPNESMNGYLEELGRWLGARGRAVVAFNADDDDGYPWAEWQASSATPSSGSASSNTTPGAGYTHAVVMRGRRPVHDRNRAKTLPTFALGSGRQFSF